MRRISLLLALLIGCAVSALRIGGCAPLTVLELRALDWRLLQRGPGPASDEVVVVAVDEASLDELGRWPWSRGRVAELFDRIAAGGARVIGVDIVQSERTEACGVDGLNGALSPACRVELTRALSGLPGEDVRLAGSVRAAGRIVLGYFFDFGLDEPSPWGGESTYALVQRAPDAAEGMLPLARHVTQNLPDLAGAAAGLGYFNFLPDPDGLYRRVPLAIRFDERIVLPLSLAMLQHAWPDRPPAIRLGPTGVEAVRLGSETLPVDARGQLLINFRGPGRTLRHVSAADVLGGRVHAGIFRDALVVVGVTAVGVGDVVAAPFDAVFPGVEVHASVLDNIVRRDFLHQPTWVGPDVAAVLGGALLLGLLLRSASGITGALLALTVLGGYLLLTQWLFVRDGLVLAVVHPALAVGLTYTAVSVAHYMTVDREKRRTRRMLDLYLSPALSRFLSDHPEMLRLGGEKRERTVLFSDVKGFTTIAERLAPEELVELLNIYLGEMTEVVFAHDGMLDKYVGDAVMAVWGAPVPQADHAARACRAALEMLDRLARLNTTLAERGWPALHIRIGLSSGPMVFGNMGSKGHLSLTVMGDNVNLGSRLEGVNKVYGTTIIASEATIAAAGETVVCRELDLVRVKGKDEAARIYEVLGPAASAADWAPLLADFHAGLAAYRGRDFATAIAAFERVLDARPNDHPAALYIRRARAWLASPPPADWDAVVTLEEK